MSEVSSWQGLPYHPISLHYLERFGEKVMKVPVSVAESCPNRDGVKGERACIFCDEWGSAAYPEFRDLSLRHQILSAMGRIKARFNCQRFIVYFQAYTTSYERSLVLKRHFDVALKTPDVLGLVVGTRPDCISDAVLDLWAEYSERCYFAVELGVQSFSDTQLKWMKRGHDSNAIGKAVRRFRERCPRARLGIHLMLGWPGETEADVIWAAQMCNELAVDDVKLHNLHVLKNTELEKIHQEGGFRPIDRAEYARWVVRFCQHLDPRTAIHRLAAVASRHDDLVAPEWAKSKLDNYQFILNEFRQEGARQGQYFIRSSLPWEETPSGREMSAPCS